MSVERQRRRLRAPSEDRGVLIKPGLFDARTCLTRNQSLLDHWSHDFAGQDAQQLRHSARRLLLEQAVRYTNRYRTVNLNADVTNESLPIVLTGHQPELFHPGVWFKNFVLHELGAQLTAAPVHLLIDNDLCSHTSLRVPTGTIDQPVVSTVAFDHGVPLPFEERRVNDFSYFSTLAERLGKVMEPWGLEPLLHQHWPSACESIDAHETLGARLARMRHSIEAQLGLQTLELPLSAVCDSQPFARFVADLIGRSKQWHTTYNEALEEFRLDNRIRSQTHPVPNLSRDDTWYEIPLWIWTAQDPSRRRPLVRALDSHIEMRVDDRIYPLGNEGDHWTISDRLLELRTQGIKIRPRAIVTTLFGRLFLSDLFIHGIGGAKYDELTDVLIERLYQVKPPMFLTVTATVRLPLEHEHIVPERASELKHMLRELRYHPERYLKAAEKEDDKVSRWVAEKQRWIGQKPPRGSRKQRHDAIQAANEALSKQLNNRFQVLRRELEGITRGLRHQSILESREYSFGLFPCKFLQDALFDCLSRGA